MERGALNLEEYEHAPAQSSVTRAQPLRTGTDSEGNVRNQSAHQIIRCHRADAQGIATSRSMPHNNECRMWIRTSMEQSVDGSQGMKGPQRQDRHLEKAVARSVEEDPAFRLAEEELKRKLVEIANEDGSRGSVAEREVKRQNQDEQPRDDTRRRRRT